jgi:signal transduction histidine kinase
MSLDVISLLLFIHFTGGVETPLFVFFIFHVIIGSLILPGPVIYFIVSVIYLFTVLIAYLEYNGFLPHYSLEIYNFEVYNNETYLFIYFTVFGIGLYLSTYLANSIAKELYIRESKLSKTLFELGQAEKSKSRYVMTIVHDLKTPIAAATTYLNMILDGTLGDIIPTQKLPLERSKFRLSNAINTINDILQISQLKIESSIEDIEDVNLISVFSEILEDTHVLIGKKELDYQFNSSNLDSIIVQAEPKLLKLVLANLVSNAIKYTEKGGKVYVDIKDSRDLALITVTDNGIGIPQSDQDRIFNSFFRSSISKQKEIEGSGLGLSLVKEVIEKYKGTVALKSPSDLQEEGRPGTQFIITLPKVYRVM